MNLKKNKFVLIGGAIILIGIISYYSIKKIQKPKEATTREHLLKKGDLQVTILATGTVQPENRLEIKPPVAGRVDQVLVHEGQKVQKGQILAWMSSSERAAMIDSARAQGPAEVKRWEEMYKPTPIIAPITGMIILKNVESGQTFTINDAVLVMSNRLSVQAQVDETDLAQIKNNQDVEVRLDAYPENKIQAKVERIAYEAKTISNVTTYLVVVSPKEIPEFMRSGMTANVTFFIEVKKGILLAPTEFIKYDNGKPFLKIKTSSEQNLADREIKLGATDGKHTEILSGANEDDLAVLEILKKDIKGGNPFSPMGNKPRTGGSGGGGSPH